MRPHTLATNLIAAARLGDINALKNALPNEVGKLGPDGLSALHVAILANHEECCFLLAPYEALVYTRDGVSPLVLAIRVGNEILVEMLLEFCEDTTTQGTLSLLDEAVLCDNMNILRQLLTRDFTMEQVLRALRTAHGGASYDAVHMILSDYLLTHWESAHSTGDKPIHIPPGLNTGANISANVSADAKVDYMTSTKEAMRNTAPLSISQLQQSPPVESATEVPQTDLGHLDMSYTTTKPTENSNVSHLLAEENLRKMSKEHLIGLCQQLQEELKVTTMEADRLERILAEVNNAETSILQASRALLSPVRSITQPSIQTKTAGTSPILGTKDTKEAEIVSLESYKQLQNVLMDLQITFEGMQKRMTEVELAYTQEKRNSRELREKLRERLKDKSVGAHPHNILVQKRPTSAQASQAIQSSHVSQIRASSLKKGLPTPTSIAVRLAVPTAARSKESEIERLRMEIISKNTEILSIQAQIHSLEHASLHTYGAVQDKNLIIEARERLERAKHRSRVAQMQLDKLLMSSSYATPQRLKTHG